jgi:hypothetical protein
VQATRTAAAERRLSKSIAQGRKEEAEAEAFFARETDL